MSSKPPRKPGDRPDRIADKPDWAEGLRQLYDAVVDEPLPDSFKNLLAQLDQAHQGRPPEGGGDTR